MRSRLIRLLLIAVVCAGVFLFPGMAAAQTSKAALSLNPMAGYHYRTLSPGEQVTVYLELRNLGEETVNNIAIKVEGLEGWTVKFNPDSLSSLEAGASKVIKVEVVAPGKADKEEYTLTVLAEADETSTLTSSVLRMDTGPSYWVWVGLGLGALVIAGFIIIFLRAGRQ